MPSLADTFATARSLDAFIADAVENQALWRANRSRASVPAAVTERATGLPGAWRLLIIAEDWCGDAVNTVPLIVALAEAVPGWDARVIGRDAHPALMDDFLTNGARAIPIVIVLDELGEVRGRGGPRPAVLQAWVKGPGQALDKAARYKEVRTWYVRDRGATTWQELLDVVEAGARVPSTA